MINISTDDVEPLKFRPHGRISISIYESGIILYRAEGPFNQELIAALQVIEANLLKSYKQKFKRWGELVVFEHSCMALDGALAQLQEYLIDLKQEDATAIAVATAFVLEDGVEGASLMKHKFDDCYRNTGLVYQSFKERTDALVWLKEQL